MGTKMIVYRKDGTEDLRKENAKLRKQVNRYRFLAIDMLEKLEALERDCREIMEGRIDE